MEPASFISSDDTLHSVGDKISQQPEKEGNNFQGLGQDMTNFDDLESELSELPEEPSETNSGSGENLRRSGRTRIPRTLYPGQITYGSTTISSRLLDTPEHSDQNIHDSGSISSSLA